MLAWAWASEVVVGVEAVWPLLRLTQCPQCLGYREEGRGRGMKQREEEEGASSWTSPNQKMKVEGAEVPF